jgi:SPX domain protein involved in polyphosphate accumulation
MINQTSGRQELKYYINYIDYINLKNKLSTFFSKDRNSDPKGYYLVRSLYFDNKSNDNYYEKISGIEKRNKYRIRIYNLCSNPIKLEIKSKINNVIFKQSAIIDVKDIKKIISGDYNCLLNYKNTTANKIYYEFNKDYYRPVIIIDYKRDAYYFDLNNLRITFDSNIKKNEINLNDMFQNNSGMVDVLNNNKIILEIKHNSIIPVWIKNLLQLQRFERCSISKYTLSRYIEG